jgi:prepilin-type N-terminal cleavage/methylation domain-containing protein
LKKQKTKMEKHTLAHTAKGFTLIEVLVVVATVALLTAFALPTYSKFVANNQVREAVGDWQNSLQFARTEALRRNTRVTLCPSRNGTNCTGTLDDYEKGWIVFVGPTTAPTLILQDVLPKPKLTIVPGSNAKNIIILGNGQPEGNFAGMRITVKPLDATSDAMNKTLCIARTGRVRVYRDDELMALAITVCT